MTSRARGPSPDGCAEAFALLARLRRERHSRPAAETLADLFEETGAVETAASKRVGGLQAQANLERIAVAARALSEGGLSFGALVRALEDRTGSEAGEPRAFEEEVEAVRILTMHKAKGLEFKVTIITGLGAESGGRSGSGPVTFGGDGAWGASLGIGGIQVDTPDLVVVRDQSRERDLAEEKRLFYVACTRARDLLVISHYRDIKDTQERQPFRRRRPRVDALRPVPPAPRARGRESRASWSASRRGTGPATVAGVKPSAARPAEEIARELDRVARRPEALEAERSLKLRRAGHGGGPIEEADSPAEDLPFEERERLAASAPAVRIGSAVHEAMQAIVERGTGAERAVAEASAAWELSAERAREVSELVARLTGSELFARSARAVRRLAELPVLFLDPEGFLVEGKIDLLFEEDAGFVVVDYKTDRDIAKRMPEYTAQLADYRAALGAIGLSKPVAAAYLLSARDGKAITIP